MHTCPLDFYGDRMLILVYVFKQIGQIYGTVLKGIPETVQFVVENGHHACTVGYGTVHC